MPMSPHTRVLLLAAAVLGACSKTPEVTEGVDARMTGERLGELVLSVDAEARLIGSTWELSVAGMNAAVVYDSNADRMRIVIPVGPADALDEDELTRLMQANFDSALDARYAIAQGLLWGTYIHPLSSLTEDDFLSGLRQTVSVVDTFGDTYSSGEFVFNSGDSGEIERQRLLDELNKEST
ncbi:MAG: type III secretion system chaperone [Pseudomonadota bacterium]